MITEEKIQEVIEQHSKQFPKEEDRKIVRTIVEDSKKTFWVMEFNAQKNNLRYVVRQYPTGEHGFVLLTFYVTQDDNNKPFVVYTLKSTPVIHISTRKAMQGDLGAQIAISSLIHQYPLEQHYSKYAPFLVFGNSEQGIHIKTRRWGKDPSSQYAVIMSLKKTIVRYAKDRYFVLSFKNPEQGKNSCVKHIYGFFRLENGKFFVEDYPLFIAKISAKTRILKQEMDLLHKQNQLLKKALGPYAVVDGMGVVENLPKRSNNNDAKSMALIPTLGRTTLINEPKPTILQLRLWDLFQLLCEIAIFNEVFFHRDIHPGNIIRQFTGELTLIDFGLALLRDEHPKTGFPPCEQMPPEMVFGGNCSSTDSYAFAGILEEFLSLNSFDQVHYHLSDQSNNHVFLSQFSRMSQFTYYSSRKGLEEKEKEAFYEKHFPLTVLFLENNLDKFFFNNVAAEKKYKILRDHYLNALCEYYDLNVQLEKANNHHEADNIKKSLSDTRGEVIKHMKNLIALAIQESKESRCEKPLSMLIKEHTDNLLSDLHEFLRKMTGNKELICIYRDYKNLYFAVKKLNCQRNDPLELELHFKRIKLEDQYAKCCEKPLRLTPQEGLFEFYLLLQQYCLPEEMTFFTLRMLQFLRVASNVPLQYMELSSRLQNSQNPKVLIVTLRDSPPIKSSLKTFRPTFFSISKEKKPLPSPGLELLSELPVSAMRKTK